MTQYIVLLLYNLLLTAIYAIAAVCAYYFYLQKKNTLFISLVIMFCAYLFDNTIVGCTELIPEFATLYDTTFMLSPSIKTVYFTTLIASMLYTCLRALNGVTVVRMIVPVGLFAAILISCPLIPDNSWQVYIYYLCTQIMMLGMALWGLRRLKKTPDCIEQEYRPLARQMLIALAVLAVLITAEDTIVIFWYDIFTEAGLKINNRNATENILMLVFALTLIRRAQQHLVNHIKETSRYRSSSLQEAPSPFKVFCNKNMLTDRESEILEYLLNGKSQQEISDELVIALGTVKTHIHNIYQKAGVANRSQLLNSYDIFSTSEGENSGLPVR